MFWNLLVSGFLRRITAHSGESLPVAALLGVIADDGASEDEINSFIELEQAEAEKSATEASDPLTVIKSFEWNSLNIRYIDSGEGGNPLICLHGFGEIKITGNSTWRLLPHTEESYL